MLDGWRVGNLAAHDDPESWDIPHGEWVAYKQSRWRFGAFGVALTLVGAFIAAAIAGNHSDPVGLTVNAVAWMFPVGVVVTFVGFPLVDWILPSPTRRRALQSRARNKADGSHSGPPSARP